jgi:hypothetical protein
MMMMMMKILINENCRIIFIYVEKETNERTNIIAKSFAKETEKKREEERNIIQRTRHCTVYCCCFYLNFISPLMLSQTKSILFM